jgi:endonuclease-3
MKKERAKKIGKILDELFPNPPIPLKHENAYTLLIAVLLSAQCTDERVNQVTPHLFALGKTPEKLSQVPIEDIEAIIRPCGLFKAKARAISKLSSILVDTYQGKVPSTFDALESLPGVGHKTASVVMAQAFHIPAFPVDTHIFRLAHRWHLSKGKTVVAVEKDLKRLFPKEEWIRRHLQIIYFARAYCPARGHKIEKCPICSFIVLLPSIQCL